MTPIPPPTAPEGRKLQQKKGTKQALCAVAVIESLRPMGTSAFLVLALATASAAAERQESATVADIPASLSAEGDSGYQLDIIVGQGIFRKLWVSAPGSTRSSDGLGPLFNARSCQSCHTGGGRGPAVIDGKPPVSLVLRLSVPPATEAERAALAARRLLAIPEPTYGEQLQTAAVQGLAAEGRIEAAGTDVPARLGDGSIVRLRAPTYRIAALGAGALRADTMISPRLAPPLAGIGLLEAIPDADILAGADPDDADADGISGRANRVWSTLHGRTLLGRFGWKAGQPTVADQIAAAFASDIGISTPLRPASWGDCTAREAACRTAPSGGSADSAEAPDAVFDRVVLYVRSLGAPPRRGADQPQVEAGRRLFDAAGCAACHRPTFVINRGEPISPYSDLLLHDMGDGLADGRPEGDASGREWRTAPLWGLGRAGASGGGLLHDGRARTPLEAILWHGGEAQAARDRIAALPAAAKATLLAFLDSL
jgi:CxxC motif-containing protein (DUF1111 family)